MKKGIYKHYKGNLYEVLESVYHSETQEKMVLYRPLYGERNLWVRPYDMFFENISLNGKEQARFAYVGETCE